MTRPAALKALMAGSGPHAVVDVREPMEFHEGQIFCTTNVPRGHLEFRIASLVPVRSTPIVLVDEGGPRAQRSADTLRKFGYSDVSALEGGLAAWQSEGLGLVSGTNVPSKDFGERVHVENAVPEIGARELYSLIEGGPPPRIFDTRTEAEFERFSLPTARSLPGGELILHAWDFMQEKEAPLIINCAGRTRSIIGTQALRRLGCGHARALKNGGMGIMLEGLPLDRGRPSEVPVASEQSRAYAEELGAQLAAEENIPFVTADALAEMLERANEQTLYLLDVRLAPEFRSGHIPGAISIPGGQAVQRTDEVLAVRAATIVTCCDANARGIMATYWLRQMGLNVHVLEGGLSAWRHTGRAVEAEAPAAGGESPALAGEVLGLDEARRNVEALGPAHVADFAPSIILDVDTSANFTEGHLPGARWMPRAWLEERVGEAVSDRGASVLATCRDGARSALAAHALCQLGYRAAAFLEGGKGAWTRAGEALESGSEGVQGDPKDVQLKPYDISREAMEEYLAWEEKLGEKYGAR